MSFLLILITFTKILSVTDLELTRDKKNINNIQAGLSKKSLIKKKACTLVDLSMLEGSK